METIINNPINTPKLKTLVSLEFSDMIEFLRKEHELTYDQVEEMLPHCIYEGNYHLYADGEGNSSGDWFNPLGKWLIDNNIESVYMYHDN